MLDTDTNVVIHRIVLGDFIEWAYGFEARKNFVLRVKSGSRVGQAFMNTLSLFDFESYQRLTGSLWDPFYDDKRLPEALDRMTKK